MAELLVPDDLEIGWDAAFNEEVDGAVALVPVDVMVYALGAGEGEPVAGVELELSVAAGPGGRAGFVDAERVAWVEDDACDDCAPLWDMHLDRAFWLVGEGESALDSVAPQYRAVTDTSGLARAYVFIDAFPVTGSGWSRGARGRASAEAAAVSVRVAAPGLEGVPAQRFALLAR